MAKAECVTESDDIDGGCAAGGGDHLTCGDCDIRRGEGDGQALKANRGGGRLGRGAKAGEALLAGFDDALSADADEVGREELRSLLSSLCVEPLVFYVEDGLRGRLWLSSERPRERDEQSGDEGEASQILMKIFLR